MGEVTEIAKSSDSVPQKAKELTNLAVDKTVEKMKKESGSTASAVKGFIAGITPPPLEVSEVNVRWIWWNLCCFSGSSVRFD